ncbi:MAG: multidrug transporter, partial [Giesbergeria sp.]
MRLTLCAVAVLAAGCSFAPTYQRPEAPVAADFPGAQGASEVAQPTADRPWQEFVQDARLRAIIARALDGNRDLRVAALAIEQARAQ